MESAGRIEARPWQVIQDEIAALLDRVDVAQVQGLLAAMRVSGGRWFFSGQGRSGLIAHMTAMRFMHAGLNVHVVGEATAPAVGEGDRLVLFCGSGKTPVSVGFAQIAKTKGAILILVTHKPATALAGMVDLLLSVPMEASVQFGGTLFEQVCLILFDTLALLLTGTGDDAHATMWKRHTNMQ